MAKKDTKTLILITAARLFRKQGYHATGLNQIIRESGAPKGSLYHHFPNGKEELAVEAIRVTRNKAMVAIKQTLAPFTDPLEATKAFFLGFQDYFNLPDEEDDATPIGLLALETSNMSEALRLACQQTYKDWQMLFQEKYMECGMDSKKAEELSLLVIALVEGAVTISVVNHSCDTFTMLANQIPPLFTA